MSKSTFAVLLIPAAIAICGPANGEDYAMNHPPTVIDQNYAVDSGTTLTVNTPGVLVGSRDIDSDALTAILVSKPSNGDLDFNSGGSFTYTPNSGFTGTDIFTYKANDGRSDSGTAKVTITVSRQNHAPTVVDQSYTVDGGELNVYAPGVLSGALDPDGDAVRAVLVSRPSHGSLDFNEDGSFKYTPDSGYVGSDKFTYKATDNKLDSKPASVMLKVKSQGNRPPKVIRQSYTTGKDNDLTVYAPGVLSGALDPDGDAVHAVLVSRPSHGSLDFNEDGSFKYSPYSGYVGTDQFSYKATDNKADSKPADVVITVTEQQDTHTIEP